jgi:calcineurin-like phosphoesterase family protein
MHSVNVALGAIMSALVFLHLSDIHFRKKAGEIYDPFRGVRNELELDLTRFSTEHFEKVTAILITGDIAYSGHPEEYAFATTWIAKIARSIGLDPEADVYLIPGNHDIERKVVADSPTIQGYHATLRSPDKDVNESLVGYLEKDEEAKRIIFKPLKNFNDFAAKYQCDSSAEHPYWEHPFKLNDGSTLMVRGVNSTLASDEHDTDGAYKHAVGNVQLDILRQDGVEYMALCHHPPSWLVDADAAELFLTERARVQLFGHKHKQRMNQLDNSVRVVAGAVHPETREPNWQPRYNFVSLEVMQQGDARTLCVQVYPRVYIDTSFQSGIDQATSRRFDLPLPRWIAPVPISATAPVSSLSTDFDSANQGGLRMRPGRRLTYRFLSLPHNSRLKIVQQLDLIRPEDEGLRDSELYSRFFSRAAAGGGLFEFWNLINSESDTYEDNPFPQTARS